MSFHIDILSIRHRDGEVGLVEIDYSIQDCVDKGWLDPTGEGTWTRKEINIREHCDEGESPVGKDIVPDPRYGEKMNLKLIQHNGRWMADMGRGLLFR